MFLVYKDHVISSIEYDGLDAYQIKPIDGEYLSEIAANIKTAKKWVDALILEKKYAKLS